MIPLDIVSDPVCPWCYIGKARLDHALETAGDMPFDIRWRAYQLNPDMPPGGMDRQTYLRAKFGDRLESFYGQIAKEAEASGLDIAFDRISRTPNTVDAHRLIHWARAEGCQTPVMSSLFRRYFREGEDISDHEVLSAAGADGGMDADLVLRLLGGDADRAEILAEDAGFREMGVQGVPCFIIGGKYVVNGAQPSELWTKVIGDIEAQQT